MLGKRKNIKASTIKRINHHDQIILFDFCLQCNIYLLSWIKVGKLIYIRV